MAEELKIKSNNTPIIVGLIILILLLSPIIWFVNNYVNKLPGALANYKIVIIAIIAGTIFFAFYALIKQFKSKKPAIIINDSGITDSSSFASVGFIPWADISGIEITSNSLRKKLLAIKLTNPENYLTKGNTNTKRKVLESYLNTFGTPVVISASSIKFDFDKLTKIIEAKLDNYKVNEP